MRDASINLRVKPEQRDLIDHAASVMGKNRSDFMMEVACQYAQDVLLDRVFFRVGAESMEKFMTLLDATIPTQNAGRDKLMAVDPVWNKQNA